MKLSDILPLQKWVDLEKEIHRRSGLNASVFDADGIRITDFQKWANRLCPVIKSNKNGQSFICTTAHLNISEQAKKTRKCVIGECDAGLVKMAVPIFVGDEFLGVAGGCGLLLINSLVDSFLIHKITGIDIENIDNLSKNIGIIAGAKLESVIKYIEEQIDWIKHDFEKQYFISVGTN
jgi:ligand-binding sensor protein